MSTVSGASSLMGSLGSPFGNVTGTVGAGADASLTGQVASVGSTIPSSTGGRRKRRTKRRKSMKKMGGRRRRRSHKRKH